MRDSSESGRRYRIEGRVQGVSFRYFTRQAAERNGLRGWVRNRPDGSVEALAVGTPRQLESFEEAVAQGPPLSRVQNVQVSEAEPQDVGARFEIVH